MKIGHLLWLVGLAASLVLLLGLFPGTSPVSTAVLPQAYAEDMSCGLRVVQGSYIYSADGYLVGEGSNTPIAEAGVYTYDGAGHFLTKNTLSFGGTILPRTGTGTYTVNSDCTGSAAVDGGVTFNFAMSRSSGELRFVVSTPTLAVSGTMTRQ